MNLAKRNHMNFAADKGIIDIDLLSQRIVQVTLKTADNMAIS
jgi:hypothetical protein